MQDATCSIADCPKPPKSRTWCDTHYMRYIRHRSPYALLRHVVIGPPEVRFWAKVDKNGPNGCWVWTASTFAARNGYGKFNAGSSSKTNHTVYAHRFSYELAYGFIPEDMDIMHLCDNPPCVNPQHLEAGTAKENMMHMVRKGRDQWSNGKRKARIGCTVESCDRKHSAHGLCKNHYERQRLASKK